MGPPNLEVVGVHLSSGQGQFASFLRVIGAGLVSRQRKPDFLRVLGAGLVSRQRKPAFLRVLGARLVSRQRKHAFLRVIGAGLLFRQGVPGLRFRPCFANSFIFNLIL